MLNNVIIGWLIRRALEIGGLVGSVVMVGLDIWNSLPPAAQDAVMSLLSRNWEGITLGSLVPLAMAIWGYAWSFKATVQDQAVANGKKVKLDELPQSTKTMVKEKVKTVVEKKKAEPGILERLFGKR